MKSKKKKIQFITKNLGAPLDNLTREDFYSDYMTSHFKTSVNEFETDIESNKVSKSFTNAKDFLDDLKRQASYSKFKASKDENDLF